VENKRRLATMGGMPAAALLAAACVLSGAVPVRGEDPVAYELLSGSTIIDACDNCNRIPIERALSGSFKLALESSIPGATTYGMTEIAFADAAGDYTVSGAGVYRQIVTFPANQQMELEVGVNATGGVKLATDNVVAEALWPLIAMTPTEPTVRDPAHIYTIRLVAAPRPSSWQLYKLVDGSEFTDDCGPCGRRPLAFDASGTFKLGAYLLGADMPNTYIVDGLDALPTPDGYDYHITGGGIYLQGGDIEMVQYGSLVLTVNEHVGVVLSSPSEAPKAPWPKIDVTFKNEVPFQEFFTFTLHLVAEPIEDNHHYFLRGDGNADGHINIADAIYTLAYLFGQGATPACRAAADANDDDGVNIADAIRVLAQLFFSPDPPLPDPFTQCGPDPTAGALDCVSFAPCP
jgi:hypothetical protein